MPHTRLLGGFADGFGPKGSAAPAFPQVGDVGSEQHPQKTAQKSGTHVKIMAHFLQNRPEVAWPKQQARATGTAMGAVTSPETFPTFPLAHCFGACYCLEYPRVARPASWQIGFAPTGVAGAAAVLRIFPHNLISDALRVVVHASLPPICAFPVAS